MSTSLTVYFQMRPPPLPTLLGGGPGKVGIPQYTQPTFYDEIVTWLCKILLVITFPFSILFCLKIVNEYKRMVVFRLGKILNSQPLGPGIVLLLPFIDDSHIVDLRFFNILNYINNFNSEPSLMMYLPKNFSHEIVSRLQSTLLFTTVPGSTFPN